MTYRRVPQIKSAENITKSPHQMELLSWKMANKLMRSVNFTAAGFDTCRTARS